MVASIEPPPAKPPDSDNGDGLVSGVNDTIVRSSTSNDDEMVSEAETEIAEYNADAALDREYAAYNREW